MWIFITGFERSGTTLLRRLLRQHKDIVEVFHENAFLSKENYINEIKSVLEHDPYLCNWGEKIPYYSLKATKGDKPIKEYVNEWVRASNEDYRIIHILRNPIDVAISGKRTFGKDLKRTLINHDKSVYDLMKFLEDKKSMNVKYEELVLNTDLILKNIFKFCGLSYDENEIRLISNSKRDKLRYFDGVEKSRAFAYKNDELYKEILDIKEVNVFETAKKTGYDLEGL